MHLTYKTENNTGYINIQVISKNGGYIYQYIDVKDDEKVIHHSQVFQTQDKHIVQFIGDVDMKK